MNIYEDFKNSNRKNNVLSLFDGISVAQISINNMLGDNYNYYASEIDKNAIRITQHHFPNTIQLGDVRSIDADKLPRIDLMIWGSPCQDLSIANKNRLGLNGEKSSLFYEALRIFKKVQPKYFVMENVASMPDADRDFISKELGVEPLCIDSSILSPALRKRYYWTNIPQDGPIAKLNFAPLKKSLENGYTDRIRSTAILTRPISKTNAGLLRYLKKSFGQVVWTNKKFAKLSKATKIKKIENGEVEFDKVARLMTKAELCRMQGVPDNYCDIVSYHHAHHCIGNSFTLPVIQNILQGNRIIGEGFSSFIKE